MLCVYGWIRCIHTGIHTGSEASAQAHGFASEARVETTVLRLLLWHGKAVEPFAYLHGQFDFD